MAATPHPRNNFDLMRLAAALMVVAGHDYVLSGRGGEEPLARYTGLGGFGELGVSVFFVISGFLVAGSYLRLKSLPAYLAHRCLRLLPALAVATALTAFVLGPLVTRLPAGAYFADGTTWLYPLRNVLLYPVTYHLPGVFAANPYPVAVNGSLWTLRLEFSLYLVLPVLAALGLIAPRRVAVVVALAAAAYLGILWSGTRAPAAALIGARNGYLFLAGSALYAWRDRLRPQVPAVLAPALALFIAAALSRSLAPVLTVLVLPLVVIGLGQASVKGLSGPLRFGDLSYGVYIYAFPVQQALMQRFGPPLGLGPFLAATLALVLPLAAASWWLVERPALALKRRVDRAAQPVGLAAAEQA
jgi:peptidoglycan/LPS O-acetylase OafA/YrhL